MLVALAVAVAAACVAIAVLAPISLRSRRVEENINPRRPTRLPLLFALDKKLGIANGFVYALDCNVLRRQSPAGDGATVHCGSDFGSTSFDGTTDGFGDWSGGGGESGGAGATSDGGGGGGGDGGGGCSGGCSS